ncbi:hypothetical protein CHUAL_009067 [Chamberlinius hualienensis]
MFVRCIIYYLQQGSGTSSADFGKRATSKNQEQLANYLKKLRLHINRGQIEVIVKYYYKVPADCYVTNLGHSVTGIELSILAIKSFFREQELNYTTSEVPNGTLYSSEDGKIKIFQGDLFGFDAETIGKVDAVWDRGSLGAVYKDERIKYTELLKSFLKPGFRYLLQTMDYDDRDVSSVYVSPRSVPESVVRSLFDEFGIVEMLEAQDKTEHVTGAQRDKIWAVKIMQCDYLITDKKSF